MVEKPSEPKTEWGIYAAYFYGREISIVCCNKNNYKLFN